MSKENQCATDEGLLFQFGRVDGYKYGDTNKFSTNIPELSEICDENRILKPDYDAVHVNMGGKWRMPIETELKELITNTMKDVVTVNRVPGILFTSTKPGYEDKQLFIPFMQGCWYMRNNGEWQDWGRSSANVWSSQVITNNSDYARILDCPSNGYVNVYNAFPRSYAISVRGVFQV